MLFSCGDCDSIIVFHYRFAVPAGQDGTSRAILQCTRCGATYEVTVRQSKPGDPEVVKEVIKQRKNRRVVNQTSHTVTGERH